MGTLLVVDNVADWNLGVEGVEVVGSTEYLINPEYQNKRFKVFNLCKSYGYQTSGYYVSLLASARNHKVVPSTSTILDIKSKQLVKIRSEDIDQLIQKSLKDLKSKEFDLSIYFGKNLSHKHEKLAFELHKLFHAPLIRAKFNKKDKWRLQSISPIGLRDVPVNHLEDLKIFAKEYFSKRQIITRSKHDRFSLAILTDPEDVLPPSNPRAIAKFQAAAEKLKINIEMIDKHDLRHLAEFDGLFIRETTAVNHHTYAFAQKAEALGLVVMDDPISILRCTNKVYLAELFRTHKIPAPQTFFVHKKNIDEQLEILPIPAVLKKPDSAFSQGVVKAETKKELREKLLAMLADSDLVVVQEFIFTEFDWRVGVLNGQPLFVCKYFMARNHWQIYNHGEEKVNGEVDGGADETIELDKSPPDLIALAVKAAGLVGDGLYGVDVKMKDGKYYIIEINDNPSIDAGCEDKTHKSDIYEKIMQEFLVRMERKSQGK